MNKESSLSKIRNQQNRISQKFEKFKQGMNKIKTLNQELLRPEQLPTTKDSEKIIDKSLNKSTMH